MSNLPANLPGLLRAAGLTVVEVDGWRTRGRPPSTGGFDPVGVLNHHTGASARFWTRAKELAYAKWMFLTGRPDLPPPLCHLAIGRSGTVYVGAAGRANHAGTAKLSGSVSAGDGNSLYVGIEWMLSGTEKIPKKMRKVGVIVNAVLTERVTRTSTQTISCHYQTSVTGKWDIGDPDGIMFNGKRVLDVNKFRKDVLAEREELFSPMESNDYEWYQPGDLNSAKSGTVIGVRKPLDLSRRRYIVGSKGTSEGGGIRERGILRGRVTKSGLSFSVAVVHSPPARAPKARRTCLRKFSRVRARFKGGDLNVKRGVVRRLTGRPVVGSGVVWLVLPRAGWSVVSKQSVDVGGDHKAVLVVVRHKKTATRVRFLVINAMSVSAKPEKAKRIFDRGLSLNPDVVLGVECSDFRARKV